MSLFKTSSQFDSIHVQFSYSAMAEQQNRLTLLLRPAILLVNFLKGLPTSISVPSALTWCQKQGIPSTSLWWSKCADHWEDLGQFSALEHLDLQRIGLKEKDTSLTLEDPWKGNTISTIFNLVLCRKKSNPILI